LSSSVSARSSDFEPCSIIRSSLEKPSRSWWLGLPVAWGHGQWRSSSPPSAGYSSTGWIHMPAAGSGSGSRTTSIRNRFLAWCSRCLSRIVADCKALRFTKTRDRWSSSSTYRRESIRGNWKQKCERSSRSPTLPRSMLTWCKRAGDFRSRPDLFSLPAKRQIGKQKNPAPFARRQQPIGNKATAFDVLVPYLRVVRRDLVNMRDVAVDSIDIGAVLRHQAKQISVGGNIRTRHWRFDFRRRNEFENSRLGRVLEGKTEDPRVRFVEYL